MNNATKISEVMTSFPHSIGSDQTVATAKKMLQEHGIRHLPVREGGKLVGIVTERDLWFALKSDQAQPEQLSIQDVYTAEPYCVTQETPVSEVAQAMAEQGIGCALITENDKLVGIFTTVDACRVLAKILVTS